MMARKVVREKGRERKLFNDHCHAQDKAKHNRFSLVADS